MTLKNELIPFCLIYQAYVHNVKYVLISPGKQQRTGTNQLLITPLLIVWHFGLPWSAVTSLEWKVQIKIYKQIHTCWDQNYVPYSLVWLKQNKRILMTDTLSIRNKTVSDSSIPVLSDQSYMLPTPNNLQSSEISKVINVQSIMNYTHLHPPC